MAVALVVNITINFLLLPVLGLLGAVLGTAAANAVALALVFAANRWHGMRVELGTMLIAAHAGNLLAGPLGHAGLHGRRGAGGHLRSAHLFAR